MQPKSLWWQKTTVYQIYPRSFCDSNDDGIGDLAGVISKLDYLKELGIETLWLTPFYPSPQKDFGYDITDYLTVAREFGTLDDVKRLIAEAHSRGLKVVLDMVMNHTSDEHPWFVESRSSRQNPMRDFYIWRPGKKPGPPERGGQPPNNWRSMVGPRGWQYDAKTDEWYYASFFPFQPDLNYRNPAVKNAMFEIVRTWLRFGVDGMRLDIIGAIYKDPAFRDSPFALRPIPSEDNPDGFFQDTRYTANHPDTFAFVRELRAVVDEFKDESDTPTRFLVGEVFGSPALLRKYCAADESGRSGLHLVFLFKAMRTGFSATEFRKLIAELEHEFPAPLLPTYVFSNHDRPRSIEKLDGNSERAKLLCALQLTVRGIPFVYYGEEIGMQNPTLPLKSALDPMARRYTWVPQALVPSLRRRQILLNRDECRTPMQWSSARGGGFTSASVAPWLPLHPDAGTRNVANQDRDPESILSCYRRFLQARRDLRPLSEGSLELLPVPIGESESLLAYERRAGEEVARVVLNFSNRTHATSLLGSEWEKTVSTYSRDTRTPTHLRPYEGAVFLHARRPR